MPVQPVISLEQIVIIVAFLMMLFALMWFVRRHRGGITSRIHADRRMQHIEDLSLAPQQRLHLIEVDGRTFLVHAGKGHAASFIAVDGEVSAALDTPSADPWRRAAPPDQAICQEIRCRRAGCKAEKRFCRRHRAGPSQQSVAGVRQMSPMSSFMSWAGSHADRVRQLPADPDDCRHCRRWPRSAAFLPSMSARAMAGQPIPCHCRSSR